MKPLCTAEIARLPFTSCYHYSCYNLFYESCNRTFLYSRNHPKRFQFSSVVQSCLTLCDPMDCTTPGLPVHHQLPELSQTHVHRVSGGFFAVQLSHPHMTTRKITTLIRPTFVNKVTSLLFNMQSRLTSVF